MKKYTIYYMCFFGDIGLLIGQVKVDDKFNEITIIPKLLKLIDINGTIMIKNIIDYEIDINRLEEVISNH